MAAQSQPQPPAPSWVRAIVIGRRPRWTLIRIVVLVITCVVVFKFILLPIRIVGPSMLPTYRQSGFNLVNRLAYLRHEPQRGDVVSIRFTGHSIMLMKRVVGLPGETVAFAHGQLLINGQPFPEPYVKLPCKWDRAPRTLGPTEYFVVGDNRSMRLDLHEHGAVERKRIVGKVLL